jgi:hypothetical protein
MINPSDVLSLIVEERVEQDVEHGSLETHGHTIPEWYVIIEVLIRKAAREWYDKKQAGAGGQTKRLVQIAAVATASPDHTSRSTRSRSSVLIASARPNSSPHSMRARRSGSSSVCAS